MRTRSFLAAALLAAIAFTSLPALAQEAPTAAPVATAAASAGTAAPAAPAAPAEPGAPADRAAPSAAATDKREKTVKARVLFTGAFGKVNEVVHVTRAQAAAGKAAGELDDSPGAVAYAESLAAE